MLIERAKHGALHDEGVSLKEAVPLLKDEAHREYVVPLLLVFLLSADEFLLLRANSLAPLDLWPPDAPPYEVGSPFLKIDRSL